MNWHDYFTYDAATGNLIWKKREVGNSIESHQVRYVNGALAGKVVASRHKNGYIYPMVGKRQVFAHRIIWEMHHGPIPEGMQIDHINGVRDDNRLSNLRTLSHKHNSWNRGARTDNISGVRNVQAMKDGRFRVRIMKDGKRSHVGYYHNITEAEDASKKKMEALFNGISR